MVRGPGIPEGASRTALVNSVDLRPTFEDIADASTPAYVDGRSWLPLARGQSVTWRRISYSEGLRAAGSGDRTPYRATYSENFAYHLYVSGEEEFYDLGRDPYELDGRLGTGEAASPPLTKRRSPNTATVRELAAERPGSKGVGVEADPCVRRQERCLPSF